MAFDTANYHFAETASEVVEATHDVQEAAVRTFEIGVGSGLNEVLAQVEQKSEALAHLASEYNTFVQQVLESDFVAEMRKTRGSVIS